MKHRIEMIANVVVILLAVVIGTIFLKDRFASPAPEANEVKAGDKLASPNGWDWSVHDRTLMLVLRKGCHFCEDSAPFYQRLAAEHQEDASKTALVAVFPDSATEVKEVVATEGLGLQALPGVPLEKLKASGTPTVLLVDRNGTVLNAWIGMLSPKQELEVLKAACAGGSCGERTQALR
jgi:hypothetical protein